MQIPASCYPNLQYHTYFLQEREILGVTLWLLVLEAFPLSCGQIISLRSALGFVAVTYVAWGHLCFQDQLLSRSTLVECGHFPGGRARFLVTAQTLSSSSIVLRQLVFSLLPGNTSTFLGKLQVHVYRLSMYVYQLFIFPACSDLQAYSTYSHSIYSSLFWGNH